MVRWMVWCVSMLPNLAPFARSPGRSSSGLASAAVPEPSMDLERLVY